MAAWPIKFKGLESCSGLRHKGGASMCHPLDMQKAYPVAYGVWKFECRIRQNELGFL